MDFAVNRSVNDDLWMLIMLFVRTFRFVASISPQYNWPLWKPPFEVVTSCWMSIAGYTHKWMAFQCTNRAYHEAKNRPNKSYWKTKFWLQCSLSRSLTLEPSETRQTKSTGVLHAGCKPVADPKRIENHACKNQRNGTQGLFWFLTKLSTTWIMRFLFSLVLLKTIASVTCVRKTFVLAAHSTLSSLRNGRIVLCFNTNLITQTSQAYLGRLLMTKGPKESISQ